MTAGDAVVADPHPGAAAARAPRPLRVLLVTAHYFPSMGGVETHVYEVARRLVRQGADVTVLTTTSNPRLPAVERSEGVRIQRVRTLSSIGDTCFAPGIYRAVVDGQWDIVHCQGCHTLVAPLAMFAARRAKVPYVVTFHTGGHSSRLRNAIRGAQWSLLRPLLAQAKRLIGVSRFEVEFFRERLHLPIDRFVVIPNGGHLPRALLPAMTATPSTLIVSIGRLERYKGHHRMISALPLLKEHYPDVRLLILGTGPYEATLRRLAHEEGIADRVEIRAIPPSDRGGMAAVLAQAALVTLLSDYEAHPVAVMEALTLGLPVLVADTSGLRELAERGLVRAIPLRSTARDVAAAAIQLLREPPAPFPVTLPTWDDCSRELLTLYDSSTRGATCAS